MLLAASLTAGLLLTPQGEAAPDFARQVRPILADRCFACHGPDGASRQAGLRLDRREDLVRDRGGWAVVVPGDPEASELVFRIRAPEAEDRMPPPSSHKTLSEAEKDLLEAWVRAGAPWEEHWSLVPPRRPEIPEVERQALVATPVDAFLLARLEREGLPPAAEAEPRVRLRRLYLDLTGLAPTEEEVRSFLADQEEGAWERRVEELLHSPRHAERMAQQWLDLARFADTVGYHGDQTHRSSLYRDWVIFAFRENLPFDRFTRMQLAGDFLPGEDEDARIASCYNRLLQTSHEGGVQLEEYAAIYDADRVRNFGSAWLGLTVGCAQCHDHKFDPIAQREFYELAAFFADIDDLGHLRDDSGRNTLPTRREPEEELYGPFEREALAALEAALARAETEAERRRLEEERTTIRPRAVMVTRHTTPREIRVLPRGNWQDRSGPVVEPRTPRILPPLHARGGRADRLDLADWLFTPRHPLTARVVVNRLWQQFFGRGLSPTTEDLGSQGQPPTHPELLDWLAVELEDSGWDLRHVIRLLVLSRAYRQASQVPEEIRRLDPGNRWFGRQNRWRVPAEEVRDLALQAGGLLVHRLGGPSVRPWQPEGYFAHLNFPKRRWEPSPGEDQYRRGLYVHWQRTFLHPMLLAFDAPTREECSARRRRSNTPSQALVLLNDPSFVEAARGLARRMLEAEGSDRERLRRGFLAALVREPEPREEDLLLAFLDRQRRVFARTPAAAAAFLAVGEAPAPAGADPLEAAAWTATARVLLNLYEVYLRP